MFCAEATGFAQSEEQLYHGTNSNTTVRTQVKV